MLDIAKVIIASENIVVTLLALSICCNMYQVWLGRQDIKEFRKERAQFRAERKEAWDYVGELTSSLSKVRILLEIIKATMKKG